MAKLYIIAGHGAGDPGAVGNGYQEAERVRALAWKIKELGGDQVEVLDTNRDWFRDGGINRLDLPKGAELLELHMDSATASARGGHVIINGNYAADDYDKRLAQNIAQVFPGRSNTIVARTDLANPQRAAARGISYRLLEVCFITNSQDMQKFNSDLDGVAKAILNAFDIPIKSSELKMELYPSNGTNAQKFKPIKNSDGTYTLVNISFDKALDVYDNKTENGTPIIGWQTHGGKNQRWIIRDVKTDDHMRIVNIVSALDTSKCVDVWNNSCEQGAPITLWTTNGGRNQQWVVLENNDGTWSFINNGNTAKLALDMYRA